MNVRHLFVVVMVVLTLSAGYVASPFVAMWNLREAIKSSDTAAIDSRVVWPSVRESLKASLAKEANLLPFAEAAGGQVRPTLWQRIKGTFGASMLDRFIETYVTPEGLPKLFDYRRTWNESINGEVPESASRLERARLIWSRVKRAEFQSLTRLEIEMVDRKVADRRIISVMELDAFTWKLTHLRIVTIAASERLADLETAPGKL